MSEAVTPRRFHEVDRIHIDVYLPVDQAEARIAAALAAGAVFVGSAEKADP